MRGVGLGQVVPIQEMHGSQRFDCQHVLGDTSRKCYLAPGQMADDTQVAQLLEVYDRERGVYSDFAKRIKTLLDDLLEQQETSIHSVTARAKDRDSLRHKLQLPDAHYNSLSSVTDLAGVRVTTYFADDVDTVGRLIENEFDVDSANSVDKRAALDPDRFGYLSLHYIVSLSDARSALPEYRPYGERKCEIQIRSVLQHAWAEIEHDLGYKTPGQVPRHLRRRFSRVAGLLELADLEFSGIRNELAQYALAVPLQIKNAPAEVLIDAVTLEAFARSDQLVAELDRHIAAKMHATVELGIPAFLSIISDNFAPLGLLTAGDLHDALQSKHALIREFADAWIGESRYQKVGFGISIMYLLYVMLGERHDREFARALLAPINNYTAELDKLIDRVFATSGTLTTPQSS